ncbi:hypothetical protein LTS18_002390, partial [Coniosporium uncinatum]
MNRLDRRATRRVFGDWKIWCGTLMYIGVVCSSYAGSFFIPTIIREMGYTAERAQVLTIPVYVVATLVSVSVAWVADRIQHRYGFCIAGVVVAAVGYAVLLNYRSVTVGVKYFALFLVVSGGYVCQ